MWGLINLDKPAGITSRDAVNRVQRLIGRLKIGHAGTLDPLAEGVLILCLGQATRLIPFVQRMPKTYRGRFQLGLESDTEDIEGQVTEVANAPRIAAEQLSAVLARFVGRIEQVPPAFSALKVEGRRAHALARQGKRVQLAARTIEIHQLELVDFDYPFFTLDIVCGSGTYVRSLGRDVARAVGSGAVMTGLQRTAIGRFQRADACRLEELRERGWEPFLLPAAAAVADLPRITLSDEEIATLRRGQPVANRFDLHDPEIAGLDPDGHLAALLAPCERARLLRPTRNFRAD
jgi:tRNA pseudouridine55 synthase